MLNPCARNSNAPTEKLLRGKLISDHEPTRSGERAVPLDRFFRDAPRFERPDADSRAGFTTSRPPTPWASVIQFSICLCNVLFLSQKNTDC